MNTQDWKGLRAQHLIGGAMHDGDPATGRFESFAPVGGESLGSAPRGGVAEARAAIAAARKVFESTPWRDAPRQRASALLELAMRLEADAKPLAELLNVENGKLLRECAGEVESSVSELRYYAGLARLGAGRVIEPMPGVRSLITQEAAGVTAIIVPWNAPLVLFIRSLAPALAAGCTVVVKAAPQVALFMYRVATHLAAVTQMPAGTVNLVFEDGHAVAQEFVRSSDVDVLSYTGSTAVGKRIMADAAGTLKRLSLELGGKAPCVVLDDANLATAVPQILAASTILSGQQCTAATRVLVQRPLRAAFEEAMAQAMRAFRVGPGHLASSDMGSLIDLPNRDRVLRLLDEIEVAGHRFVVRGGAVAGLPANGAFVSPSLVVVEDAHSPVVQNEHFAPLLTLETFDSDRDGVALANITRFGLGSSVWSRDHARAQRLAKEIRCGTVWINAHNKFFAEAESGGYRDSGFGRLHGLEGLRDFVQTKHVYEEIGVL